MRVYNIFRRYIKQTSTIYDFIISTRVDIVDHDLIPYKNLKNLNNIINKLKLNSFKLPFKEYLDSRFRELMLYDKTNKTGLFGELTTTSELYVLTLFFPIRKSSPFIPYSLPIAMISVLVKSFSKEHSDSISNS